MLELSPQQMQVIERLFAAGFRSIAIPPYESALCMKKGNCAGVLAPVPNGGIKLLTPPSDPVGGNLNVRLKRGSGVVFVWRRKEWEAAKGTLIELELFRQLLTVFND